MRKMTEAMKAAILADSMRKRRTVEQNEAWLAFLNKPIKEPPRKAEDQAVVPTGRIWP